MTTDDDDDDDEDDDDDDVDDESPQKWQRFKVSYLLFLDLRG